MSSGGRWGRILRRSGRLLMAKPSLFPALRRVFSKFRRLYRERASGFYSGPALRKTGAISFFAARFGRCLRGFWRRIREAPGIFRFSGDVRERFGCRLEDSTGEAVFRI